MSDLNLKWLKENFNNGQNLIFFDIGSAELHNDTLRFKTILSESEFHAFECNNYWRKANIDFAKKHNINYHHLALTDSIGYSEFQSSDEMIYSGRLTTANDIQVDRKLNYSYQVQCDTLNNFCLSNNIFPDIIHIDVEGSELRVFNELSDLIRPKIIWAETLFYKDNELSDLLLEYGYQNIWASDSDTLYVHQSYVTSLTNYYAVDLSFDKKVSDTIWINQYNSIRDQSWPELTKPEEFNSLPLWIQEECIQVHNLLAVDESNNK